MHATIQASVLPGKIKMYHPKLVTRLRKYTLAIALGLAMGFLSSIESRSPAVYDRLPPIMELATYLLPLIVTLLCAAGVEWWNLSVHAVYGIIVLVWCIAASIVFDMHTVGFFVPDDILPTCEMFLIGALVLTSSWGLGRLARWLWIRRRSAS